MQKIRKMKLYFDQRDQKSLELLLNPCRRLSALFFVCVSSVAKRLRESERAGTKRTNRTRTDDGKTTHEQRTDYPRTDRKPNPPARSLKVCGRFSFLRNASSRSRFFQVFCFGRSTTACFLEVFSHFICRTFKSSLFSRGFLTLFGRVFQKHCFFNVFETFLATKCKKACFFNVF